MEEPKLPLQKINLSLTKSNLNLQAADQVTAHCKRDHLSPSFHQSHTSSAYHLNYTPNKNQPNYNQPEIQKTLQKFRKNQNSTSLLPTIPSMLEHSHYHNAYNAHSLQKLPKAHEKESFFLKMNWALDPSSNYQKDYSYKSGTVYNKINAARADHNQIHIMNVPEAQRNSSYRNEFKMLAIKKEAQIAINGKDHFATKENYQGEQTISQYQRRYDSLIENAKPKESLISIYKKQPIARKPNNKL